MNKDNLIRITTKLYRITLLFPKKEPLRYKLREIADDVLSGLIDWEKINNINSSDRKKRENIIFNLEKNLDTIDAYFEVAKWQNWASYFDILEIQEEYVKISRSLNQELAEEEEENKSLAVIPPMPVLEKKEIEDDSKPIELKAPIRGKDGLDERKQKILEILKEKEKIQVWQVNEIFPDISKRTIRRDFVELLNRGLIERKGERNNTYYQLKNN